MEAQLQIERVEAWKSILGYEGIYEVSNVGRIKSLTRIKMSRWGKGWVIKEKIMKPIKRGTGYLVMSLSKNGEREYVLVHRLVAEAFIPNPENKPQVNHLDGNKANNSVFNLEWCTQKENNIHAYAINLKKGPIGEKNWFCKLSSADIIEIRKLRSIGMTLIQIAERFSISFQMVSRICNKNNWKHL